MENPEGKVEIPSDFQEKIDSIDTEVKKLLRDIDYLGEIGRIDESERLYEEVERLKRTREDLVILAENPSLASKHMKVYFSFKKFKNRYVTFVGLCKQLTIQKREIRLILKEKFIRDLLYYEKNWIDRKNKKRFIRFMLMQIAKAKIKNEATKIMKRSPQKKKLMEKREIRLETEAGIGN